MQPPLVFNIAIAAFSHAAKLYVWRKHVHHWRRGMLVNESKGYGAAASCKIPCQSPLRYFQTGYPISLQTYCRIIFLKNFFHLLGKLLIVEHQRCYCKQFAGKFSAFVSSADLKKTTRIWPPAIHQSTFKDTPTAGLSILAAKRDKQDLIHTITHVLMMYNRL